MTEATIQTGSLLKYGGIALPLAFAGLPLYIHAPDLYTRHFGLGIGLIGAILLGVRLFDAIQDPVIGFLSDKFSQYRLAIIYIGALLMGTGMLGLFSFPAEHSYTALWFAINVILATTGFSILSINLNMIGGFWVNNKTQRTRITTTRESLSLIGLLLAAAFPSIASQFVSDQTAYSHLAVTFTVLLIIGMWLFQSFLSELAPHHPVKQGYGQAKWSFLSILMGQQRRYFTICFLTYLAAAIPAVMVLFFIRDYLQAEAWTPLFLVIYFLSGSALMPVWYRLSKKVGKQEAWLLSMLLAVATFVWAYTLVPQDYFSYAIICLLSGCALGADLALPPSILADSVENQGEQEEGSQHFAVLALMPKIALAIASGCSFLILEQLSFVPGTNNSQQALTGLVLLYAIVPCLIKLLSAFLLWSDIKRQGD